LAKDPDARFKDADAFLKALDAAERAPDQPRPEDTAAFAAVSPEGERTDFREPDEEDWEERPRRGRGRWILAALLVAAVAGLVAFALTRPSQVAVPDVIGQPSGTAQTALEAANLHPQIKNVPSLAPRDTVTETDPIPGSKVDENSDVVLTVSTGPGSVKIPDVSGRSEADATKALEDVGLRVAPQFGFSDTIPDNRAIGTEPGVGTQIQTGQTVKLIISRGSNTVPVPSVVGEDDQAALNTLQGAELAGTIVQRDDEAPAGQVVAQSPTAGKRVKKGSAVTIFVSTGATTVPDELGQTRRTAVTALKRAGFVVSVSEQATSDPAQLNRVINQFPPGGARGQRGDTVTIVVGISSTTP
jgi:serine/threonine-protein kinase